MKEYNHYSLEGFSNGIPLGNERTGARSIDVDPREK
jgi:hypothetical protein